jgi:hypothetical protein
MFAVSHGLPFHKGGTHRLVAARPAPAFCVAADRARIGNQYCFTINCPFNAFLRRIKND